MLFGYFVCQPVPKGQSFSERALIVSERERERRSETERWALNNNNNDNNNKATDLIK